MTFRRTLSLLMLLTLAAAATVPAARADDGASAAASVAPAKSKKKAVKKKKAYDYEQSKYKAYKELVADDTHSYRFDERGNPIVAGSKKKKAAAKKKKKEEEEPASCGAGEACQDDESGAEAKASVDPGSED